MKKVCFITKDVFFYKNSENSFGFTMDLLINQAPGIRKKAKNTSNCELILF